MKAEQTVPQFNGIDHFHLYVRDKQQAVDWYRCVLGFEVYQPLKFWDSDSGPLTITDPSNTIHLALFKRSNQVPSTSIAFKTSEEDFAKWRQRLRDFDIQVRVADHQVTESLYFSDPDGNMHEITYYKETVAA